MELKYRQAISSELPIALSLLKEAAGWLREKGIDYWQSWHTPEEDYRNWIKEGFDNEEFYFVENSYGIVGMYRLQFEDEMFWGKRSDRAGYIHSFTTKRELNGNGIGQEILTHIECYLRCKGVDYLRLDCSPTIQGLCKYYENYGFIGVGEIELFGERLRLYQKTI